LLDRMFHVLFLPDVPPVRFRGYYRASAWSA
jgi:hypothetical protein